MPGGLFAELNPTRVTVTGDMHAYERPERDVQGFAEATVRVVVDLSRVDDGADPQLPFHPAGWREAGVVIDQELSEGGDSAAEQYCPGCLVDRMDEGEDAVTALLSCAPTTSSTADA